MATSRTAKPLPKRKRSASEVKTRWRDIVAEVDPLATLGAEFDRELAVLGEANASSKLRRVFASTPAQLAKAANVAASRRRR